MTEPGKLKLAESVMGIANVCPFGAVCDANLLKILGSELPPASFAQIHSPNECGAQKKIR